MLHIPFVNPESSWTDVFSTLPPNRIAVVSWPDFPYLPTVQFKIAHDGQAVFLEYTVIEKERKAVYRQTNDPVYKDSCVECFISFDNIHYYNFEFNSLGTAIVGYGTIHKADRRRLPNALIETIDTVAMWDKLTNLKDGMYWTLQLKIPLSIFAQSALHSLMGVEATANFYKCGDDLKDPHFVSWKKIETAEPNFHQPDFFGKILFEKPNK